MGQLLIALVTSYLIGSVPTAYLVVKWLKRIDVRTIGSGNVGATNVTRVAGVWAGLAVFCVDVAKGVIAVKFIAPGLLQPLSPAAQLGCGLSAVIGHIAPIFLGLRGGKGVATTIGVLAGCMPLIAGACLLVWIVCFLLWRYVSIGSLAAALTIPIAQLFRHQSPTELALGVVLSLLIVIRHRSNIERLLQGKEPRAGLHRTAHTSRPRTEARRLD